MTKLLLKDCRRVFENKVGLIRDDVSADVWKMLFFFKWLHHIGKSKIFHLC